MSMMGVAQKYCKKLSSLYALRFHQGLFLVTGTFRVCFVVDLSVDHRYSDPADWYTGWEWTSCKAQVRSNHAPCKNLVFPHKVDMEEYSFHLWART